MNEAASRSRKEVLALALTFALLAGGVFAFVGRDIDVPGLYYDEVIQAEPAVQFLAEDGKPSEIPGARTVRLFGGWFPVAIQPYMGALKSQALIPVFAAFGADTASLRLATTTAAVLGLLFALLWARDLLGIRVAIVAGVMLACDPSFLWIGRHDWGSFSLALLCRCGGLAFVTRGWQRRSVVRLFLGGLCFGLGVYNKVDFGVVLAAAALALLAVRPSVVVESLRSRALSSLAGAVGLLLGALPVIASAGAVLAATRSVVRRQSEVAGDWLEKLQTLGAMLDGSYFHRLMLSGGSFEGMFRVEGAAFGVFGLAFAAALVALGVLLQRDRRRGELDRAQAFVWLATLAIAVGLFLTPRTIRIHHALNLYPFPQLVVATALVRLFDWKPGDPARRSLARAAAALLLAAIVAGNLYVDGKIRETVCTSGGKGRWSDSLGAFAEELAARPDAVAVGLDWGFSGPMKWTTRELEVVEPIWLMRRPHISKQKWQIDGGPENVYLVFEDELAVFEFGSEFLALVNALPPGDASIRRHADREGDVAFLSVRFPRPHRLAYSGRFELDMP